MSVPVVMIVVGLLVALGSFAFGWKNLASSRGRGALGGHVRVMVGMAIGGLLFWVGLIAAVIQVLQQLLAK